MSNMISAESFRANLASEQASKPHLHAAMAICVAAGIATAGLLPFARATGPSIPGFILTNQTALLIAYALSAWVLFRQFKRSGSLSICLLAGGALYTTAIILLQLLSFPGVVAGGRVLGSGPDTTTWLWTFWHLGPPTCALAYGLTIRGGKPVSVSQNGLATASLVTVLSALALAALSAAVATTGLPWLPHQVTGDDYSALTTSGVGPAIQALTVVALIAVWRASTGRRTVLELWIIVSLVLLIFDNFLTMTGGARATVGWYVGRIEALVSAFAILWAYLAEVDALRARAEEAAESVLRSEAALRQAQKMEAVGRLTGGIAHDFNNLLMIVSSGFDMIRRRPDDKARVLKTVEAGLTAVERGSKLTRQLLTFARRQNLNPATVNPNALLIDFAALVQRAVGEAIELKFDMSPGIYPTNIDASEFQAAVLNLVVNARDAVSARDGRIVVSTRNVKRDTVPGSTDALPPGGYVVVAVSDNGFGMDEETMAQVFEPFFTTKEFGRGSGLGLSQVYGFARATGGKVEISSALGSGTTVEMWLPRATAMTAQLTDTRGPSNSPLRRAEAGETVLAVEDEPAVLAAVVESLTDLGYRVLSAQNAAEALECLRSKEKIDILFSDIVMPGGMNGVQLAVESSRVRPGLHVVLTSGYTGEALIGEHGVPAEVSILTKPYRQYELAERLKIASSR